MNTTISPGPTLSSGQQRIILGTCCLSLFLVSVDATIINVALPSIRRELGVSISGLQWVIDAYAIVLASFLMLGGSTGDRLGRKRVLQFGTALFTFGSLLCSLASTGDLLVGARVVQAVGGSMMNPVAMSIIVNTFVDPKARARAIGIWGGVAGLAMATGPLLGGALTQALGWHAIFWVNLPVGLTALWLTARVVPDSRAQRARRPDPVGQVLLLVGLGGLNYSVIESGRGSSSAPVAALVALLAFSGLVAYERRRAEPLVDLRFFRSLPFSSATVIAVSMFAALGGFLFLNSLYLQDVRGLSPFHAGLAILPTAVAVMIVSPLSGRMVAAWGARPSLLIAGSMLTLSSLLLLQVDAQTSFVYLLPVYAVFGIGFGIVNAPITNTAVSGMPRAQAGLAAAVTTTSRQIGVSVGVALSGALIGTQAGMVAAGDPIHFTAQTHNFWWVLVGCGGVIFALALLSTGARARASVERIAHLLQEPEAKSEGKI